MTVTKRRPLHACHMHIIVHVFTQIFILIHTLLHYTNKTTPLTCFTLIPPRTTPPGNNLNGRIMVIHHDRPYNRFGKMGRNHDLAYVMHTDLHGLPYRILRRRNVLRTGRCCLGCCILSHGINVGLVGFVYPCFCSFSYVILHFPLSCLRLAMGGHLLYLHRDHIHCQSLTFITLRASSHVMSWLLTDKTM